MKKKKIKLKIKKARRIFATTVSRGVNKNSVENCEKKQDESKNNNNKEERIFSYLANFALSKQLDNTLSFEEGTTSWWSARANKGYGAILKEDHDFSVEGTTKKDYLHFLKMPIPKKALENASHFRTSFYERLFDSRDVTLSLLHSPTVICFEMFEGIHRALGGMVPMPKFWQKSQGGHSVAVIGFDYQKQVLMFINSWGTDWGNNGIGYLPYKYFDKYIIEAWSIQTKINESEKEEKNKKFGSYKYKSFIYQSVVFGRQPIYVIDVYKKDQIVGWIHFRFNDLGRSIIIEEIFVKRDYRKRGVARKLITEIEEIAKNYHLPYIICYIHVQDLLFQENLSAIEKLFKDKNYLIVPYKKQFKGCQYKIVGHYPFSNSKK